LRLARKACLSFALVACVTGIAARAQESAGSQQTAATTPAANKVAAGGTGASTVENALRDAIVAACGQNQRDFSKFLTARNATTFTQLTPSARVALMKRFVLLNEPGKASVLVGPSGRPMVKCEIPDGAAELQIGGADTSDNLAFMPVEVRDATDTVGASVMHVKMGMVRENGEWKLLSVGLVLLDLPSLAAEWDAAEIDSTEQKALEGLKVIAEAVDSYRKKYARLPESLEKLSPPEKGGVNADQAGMLDTELASGVKDGYTFRYVLASASTLGAPAKFELAATPQSYGRTGRRSFFRDSNGGLHAADHQGAVGSAADSPVQ
jgi:hypothetical protein